MNKKLLSMAALAGMFLFAACSNDAEEAANGGNDVLGVSEITLALNSGSDGITTRAGRPVNSSAAANEVDRVQLKLYKTTDDGTTWTIVSGAFEEDVLKWTEGPTGEGAPGYTDRTESKKIKVKGLEKSASYKVVAYGYKADADNACAYELTDENGVFTTKALDNEGANGANIEEIFAGEKAFKTDDTKKITTFVQVEMNRMVAGMLGYFHNIPVKKIHPETNKLTAVKFIRVYTVAKATTFNFPYADAAGFNGIGQTEEKTELLSYDLSALITAATGDTYDTQVAAATTGSEVFAINAVSTGTVQKVENSVLAGRFIIPFSATVNQNTITIELQDENNVALRTWSVKASTQNGGLPTDLADAFKYDIKRNYFYSIGKKLKSDSTNPPVDPENPDKPVDLSQDNDIVLILNDAWDVVYDMELGD